MSAVTVQFCRWVTVSRVTGERRPIATAYADRTGQPIRLPESQAHAVARQLARRERSGARVVGPRGETLGPHYLWEPEEERLLALPPGRAAELARPLPPQDVDAHRRAPFADRHGRSPRSTANAIANASPERGNSCSLEGLTKDPP